MLIKSKMAQLNSLIRYQRYRIHRRSFLKRRHALHLYPLADYLTVEHKDNQPVENLPVIPPPSVPQTRSVTGKEKQVQQDLMLAVVAVGCAIVGYSIYPPLALVGMAGVASQKVRIMKDAIGLLKQGKVGVSTLSTITTAVTISGGFFAVLNFGALSFAVRNWLLLKVKDESRQDFIDIFQQYPRKVWVLAGDIEVEQPIEDLKAGDVVIVDAGTTIPVDGTIQSGVGSIDQHILTGEAQPVEKESGDPVFAMTVVLSGRLFITVEKTGRDTTAAQIGEILNNTIDFKTQMQLKAEDMADKTVIPLLLAGGAALLTLGIVPAASVVNAHFGYKMSTLAPISILNHFKLLSQQGILVKDGRVLDRLVDVDTVVFDKTGTLTTSQPTVGTIHLCGEWSESQVLAYAAAAENKQTHPIALAILEAAQQRRLDVPQVEESDYALGYGLAVMAGQRLIRVGSLRFMEKEHIIVPSSIKITQDQCHAYGHSLVMVAVDEDLMGAIELIPTVRPEVPAIIKGLRERNIKETYIISGDHEMPTRKLAQDLGIDGYFAETLPQDKAALIEQLTDEGKTICYIGDGINDSIALKKSHVAISLSGASAIATDTAQVILLTGDLQNLCYLFDLAHEYDRNLKAGFSTMVIPMIFNVVGVFLFGFSLGHIMVISQLSWLAGISNSMLPLLKLKKEREPQDNVEGF